MIGRAMQQPTTPVPRWTRQRLAELGYKQELKRGWSGFSELRDLVHDHLDPGRLLHDLRPGVEQRRPGRDLDRLAGDLDPDPDHRLLHVRARLGLPDRGRHLLVGVEARRRRLGLVHRLVQPDRADRGHRVGRLRRRDVPQHDCSASTTSTSFNGASADAARRSCTARSSCSLIILALHAVDQHLPAATSSRCSTASRSGGTSSACAVILDRADRRAGPSPEPRLRLHRALQQLRLRHPACTGSTCCRSASC